MNTENTPNENETDMRPKRRGRKLINKNPEGRGSRVRGKGRHPNGRGRNSTHAAGRGRRKRPLAHGDLRLLILNIIGSTPSHGYGLIAQIKDLTAGAYEPSPGVIYPALEALQDLEWVEVQPEKGKRVLHITDAGQAELKEQSEAVGLIQERLKQLGSTDQKVEADDIRGALRRLKHTTASTFKGKQVDVEIRKAAVTILEDARKKIEDLT